MKKLLLVFIFLLSLNIVAQQQKKGFKTLSYSELFQMIEAEQDSIFKLSDAFIVLNLEKDQRFIGVYSKGNRSFNHKDTLFVQKRINFRNVIFETDYSQYDSLNRQFFPSVNHVVFRKKVELLNSFGVGFDHCVFESRFSIQNTTISQIVEKIKNKINGESLLLYTILNSCVFESGIRYANTPAIDDNTYYALDLVNSIINQSVMIGMQNQNRLEILKNKFISKEWVMIFPNVKRDLFIEDNDFGETNLFLRSSTTDIPNFNFYNNQINNHILLEIPIINPNANIGWNQLQNKIIGQSSFDKYFSNMVEYGLDTIPELNNEFRSLEKRNYYLKNLRVERKDAFNEEIKFRGKLYRLYKEQYKTEDANSVYLELKNLETTRLKYLFNSNPSFAKYFKWKVNQFLKVFSDYGTEPSKAVTFSFYVVLFFAFIYLFFPNTWDSHGKNRIIDRYNFFFKYMKRKAGIHEVYLEDQKVDLMSYEQFKANISNSKQQVPKFFTATALPLYKWAISGTKLSAALLSKIDIMKGTWSELPQSKRIWKSILLIGAFLIAVIYDVFIKMLNALMLSINTFTTLGFGEIPIKGLPRYLAIIQGFIGWFMLTIFSVSLISQLLN